LFGTEEKPHMIVSRRNHFANNPIVVVLVLIIEGIKAQKEQRLISFHFFPLPTLSSV
jgi:hypothetical protein